MMRTACRLRSPVYGLQSLSGTADRRPKTVDLSDFYQSELLLPLFLDELQQVGAEAAFLHEATRFRVRGFHDVAVAHHVAGSQLRLAGLARAEEIPGAAQFE